MTDKILGFFFKEKDKELYLKSPIDVQVKTALGYLGTFILALWLLVATDLFSFPKPLTVFISLFIGILAFMGIWQWIRYKNR